MTESLAARVRRLRLKRKMTMRQVAEATGVSVGFISHIEGGYGFPSPNTIRALARALSVPVKHLEHMRVTRETLRKLERDPELLEAIVHATRNRRFRKRILEAHRRVPSR